MEKSQKRNLPSSSVSRILSQQETELESTVESDFGMQIKYCLNFLPKSAPEAYIYTMEEDIIVEDEDTVIHGENPLDDDERDAEILPVRRLDDFVIYDIESYEAVPLASLLEIPFSSRKFSASGLVKALMEEDSDSDSDSDSGDEFGGTFFDSKCERYSLSRIREFSLHSPGHRKGELDRFVYSTLTFQHC